jgi:two-component system alkaline phosphatase synthesis response regulator PhoP
VAKILVIEDEEHIQELVKVNLTASGYEVLVTGSGEDGLELAKAVYPDLILLDLRLPGMSGWDVLMLLKADDKLQKIPVITMTATVRQSHDSRLSGMKTAGYLTKPFEVDELLQTVKQVLGE